MWYKTSSRKWGYLQEMLYYNITLSMWLWRSVYDSKYYMSSNPGLPITVSPSTTRIYANGLTYNGYDIFPGYIWWNTDLGKWTYSYYLRYGIRSTDQYWVGPSNYDTPWGTYEPRGAAPAGNKTVAVASVLGWESNTKAGVYTPVSGSGMTGNKYFGWARYGYDTGKYFEEVSPEVLYNSKITLKNNETPARYLWWDSSSSKWVISSVVGTKAAAAGYWDCSTIEGTYSLTYSGGGDPPSPEEYVLASPSYIDRTDNAPMYMSQVGVWK